VRQRNAAPATPTPLCTVKVAHTRALDTAPVADALPRGCQRVPLLCALPLLAPPSRRAPLPFGCICPEFGRASAPRLAPSPSPL
jgi:hypothetical protein